MKNVFDLGPPAPHWASYPNFEKRFLRVIELALREAWSALHKRHESAQKLSVVNEAAISMMMRQELNSMRDDGTKVPGYDCATFERLHVGSEIETPEGKIKKPDMTFHLAGNPRPGVTESIHDGIVVECKLLDHGGKKNVSAYCKEGVKRFVDLAYGAWMREGMMLAYVRTTQAMPDDLIKVLTKPEMQDNLATDGSLSLCTVTKFAPRVYISVHKRHRTYPTGGSPGPIELRHLWLRV